MTDNFYDDHDDEFDEEMELSLALVGWYPPQRSEAPVSTVARIPFTNVVDDKGNGVLTVVDPATSSTFVVSTEQPEDYTAALAGVLEGASFDEIKSGMRNLTTLTQLSDRVSLRTGSGADVVLFDGEAVDSAVAKVIKRYYYEGRPFDGIVKFMERVADNTSYHSRAELFKWLQTQNLIIDEEGYVIGFKSVNTLEDGTYESHSAGKATVNGVVYGDSNPQRIPYAVGDVATMPRSEVDDNSGNGCSAGLHIGSESYASGFGGAGSTIMVVRVDPADVVSVPNYETTKMRACKFEVVEIRTPEFDPEPEGDERATDLGVLESAVPSKWFKSLRQNIVDKIKAR